MNYAKKYDISDFFASSSPILLYFENIDNEVFIIIMTLSTLAIGILLYLLLVANKQYLASMIAIIAWTVFTNPGIEELIIIERKDWVYPITECIEANGYDSVYYLYSADATRTENMYVGSLQYLLQEMPIHCITDINEVQDENACIIIGYSVPVIEGYKINSYTDVYRIISREEK